ncbi:MAG TPA: hypothetical protein PKJ30_16195, partial [Leptospiraceae bacterium]|nr:hypothetical protein [Leptospiraceae bacterium]
MKQDAKEAILRWRLALGPGAEKTSSEFNLREGLGLPEERLSDLDDALSFVYREKGAGGTGASAPYIPKWLGHLRDFFRQEVVAFVQKEAIEKRGLTQLLFEPETLPFLEKNVDLVSTLISARGLIPEKAK